MTIAALVFSAMLGSSISATIPDVAGHESVAAESSNVPCLRAIAPLEKDSVPATGAFVAAVCSGRRIAAPFRYDRSLHATRLNQNLAVGDVVAPFPEFGAHMVLPGQQLDLIVAIGAVRIERQVTALQEARPGQPLFVKSGDGQILSVLYRDTAP